LYRNYNLTCHPEKSPTLFAMYREKCELAETSPDQALTDCHSFVSPAVAGIDDLRHWQSTNFQRLSCLGTGPRQPRLFWLPNTDDLVDHPRFNLVRKLSRRRRCLLAAVVEKISGAGRDYQDQHR